MNESRKTESTYTNKRIDQSLTRRIMIVVVGILEVLLGARFIFKFAGANPENIVIKVLYSLTDFMVKMFASIFTTATNDGLETVSIFEPGTIIAMIVVALIAFAIFKLMNQQTSVQKNTKELNTTNQSTIVEKEEN